MDYQSGKLVDTTFNLRVKHVRCYLLYNMHLGRPPRWDVLKLFGTLVEGNRKGRSYAFLRRIKITAGRQRQTFIAV